MGPRYFSQLLFCEKLQTAINSTTIDAGEKISAHLKALEF
jgi:hypothetical protein